MHKEMPCNKVDQPELSAYQQTPKYEKTMASLKLNLKGVDHHPKRVKHLVGVHCICHKVPELTTCIIKLVPSLFFFFMPLFHVSLVNAFLCIVMLTRPFACLMAAVPVFFRFEKQGQT